MDSILCSIELKFKIIHPNGRWYMSRGPVPQHPGQDPPGAEGWRRLPADADWMTDEDWEARLAVVADEPPDPELDPDPEECAPPPGQDELTAEEIAECREIAAADARAAAH